MAARRRRAKPISVEIIEAEELNTELDVIFQTLARWIYEDTLRESNREKIKSSNSDCCKDVSE